MKRKVFVIEDHALMRRSIVEAIERESDLSVCGQVDDAPEAFPAILSSRPDVVLTDIQLKSSSGLDLIKNLRARAGQKYTAGQSSSILRRLLSIDRPRPATSGICRPRRT